MTYKNTTAEELMAHNCKYKLEHCDVYSGGLITNHNIPTWNKIRVPYIGVYSISNEELNKIPDTHKRYHCF